MRRFSVIGGEADADRAARGARGRGFEGDDDALVAGDQLYPASAGRCRAVAELGEAEGVDVEARVGSGITSAADAIAQVENPVTLEHDARILQQVL
jgi:hypothetical protein